MEFYDEIKDLVENTIQSYRSIAQQYGTNHTQIKKIAIRDKWKIEHRISKNSNIENLPIDAPHKNILGKIAIRKITEIKKELGEQYSPVDEPLIIMCAKSYEEYIDLAMKVALEGYTCVSVKTGSTYLNPTFNAYQAVQKNLITVSNQLGLSIAARKKLGLKFDRPGQEQLSIFDLARDLANTNDEDLDDI